MSVTSDLAASKADKAHQVEDAAAAVAGPSEVDTWIWIPCTQGRDEEDAQEAPPIPTLSRRSKI